MGIYSPSVIPIDTLSFQTQFVNVSYGRNINDKNEWLYYDNPTPKRANSNNGIIKPVFSTAPVFSHKGGFYTNNIYVELSTESDGEIRYTVDGSEPTENSRLYTNGIEVKDKSYEPFYYAAIPTNINTYSWIQPWYPPRDLIRQATVIRAKTFHDYKLNSNIVTNTFFIGNDINNAYEIPVISIVSDKKHLFSDASGIYVLGDKYDGNKDTGNYFFDWNRPAHFEYFDENKDLVLSQTVDIRTQGLSSQINPQKGLHIIARKKYGVEKLNYPFFKDFTSSAKNIASYKRIIARAWGSNWQYAMLSDAYAHTIYSRSSLDVQAYQPVIVFINGEYWGIQELREANKNPYYFNDHYGIDILNPGVDILQSQNGIDILNPGVDILQSQNAFVDEGDDIHWTMMINFLSSNVMTDENYAILGSYMDIPNFIDYIGHTVFCNKFDWPGQNEAFWRVKTSDGKW